MATNRTRRHIANFLMPVDRRGGVLQAAEVTLDTLKRSRAARAALGYISEWIGPQLNGLQGRGRLTGSRATVLNDDAVITLLAIAYLRATEMARSAGPTRRLSLQRVLTSPKITRRFLQRIEPGFIEGLLDEVQTRARRDPHFARTLSDAIEDTNWLVSSLNYSARQFIREYQRGAAAARANDDDGLGYAILLLAVLILNLIGISNWLGLDDKEDDDDEDDEGDDEGDDNEGDGGGTPTPE